MKVCTEQMLAEQEAKGTCAEGAKFYKPMAIGLILLQLSGGPSFYLDRQKVAANVVRTSSRHTDSTQHSTEFSVGLSVIDIFAELNRVYDLLVKQSKDLDEDSHKILYSNLWHLYD
jgi:hypothetical protein